MADELMRKLLALAEGCEAMSFGVEGNPRETDFMAADVVREAIAEIARLREGLPAFCTVDGHPGKFEIKPLRGTK